MTLHPDTGVIARYAGGGGGLDDASVWAVEVHLETCPDCRARLARSTAEDTRALLERVATGVDRGIAAGPPPVPRRRAWSVVQRRWLVWTLLPWLTMTVAVLGCAVVLQALRPDLPSLVLLLAPVAPLPGVAVAWTRYADPAWELVAGSPRAGLTMLLHRTAAVLTVVVPALALAGAGTGTSLALLLLPCLAFTAATLAVGALVGVRRAAAALGAGWALVVVLPSLATGALPRVLQPGSWTAWALTAVALAGVVATRADSFRRLSSRT